MDNLFKILGKRTINIFLLLFVLSFIFRLPTLFNDYYDVDELSAIVQTWQYLAGDIPGIDFKESKLPVYHSIFKLSYLLTYKYGWVIVHFITIIIISLTSSFIFLTGKKLKNEEAGAYAGILYAILISSFNRMFMATNGEVVYNLPITAGIYALILFFSYKQLKYRFFLFLLFLACGYIAMNIKFHGRIMFIAIAFFFIFYLPYIKNLITKKYFLKLTAVAALMIIVLIIDYFTGKRFASKIISNIYTKAFYAVADRGLNPLIFLAVYVHRQAMLLLWHFILWVPAALYVWIIIKEKRLKISLQEGILLIILIFTYLMIFGGGARLYFHYFIAAYPSLCIAAGIALCSIDKSLIAKLKNKFIMFILIPGVFFFAWNTKDIIIKYYYPRGFTNEGKILFWTRAVLTGAWDHYLLPDNSYSAVAYYIKSNTLKDDRIFVWGNGAYLYYFSERKPGIYNIWPKGTALRIQLHYRKNTGESISEAHRMEDDLIKQLKKGNSKLFIDTSQNGLAGFTIPVPRLLQDYVNKNYKPDNIINKIQIYKRIDRY